MISPDTLIQLKAFARQDGLLLALFWTASFAMTMMAPQSIWGNVLAMATPLVYTPMPEMKVYCNNAAYDENHWTDMASNLLMEA